MNIGFDFDKVLVDYPPFVPASLVNWCYRNGLAFFLPKKRGNSYRIPGPFEQRLRRLTHFRFMRPPLKKNIAVLEKIHSDSRHRLFLVSGRFGFLERESEDLLDTYDLRTYFTGIYFNYENSQPHVFKERVIQKNKITVFVDDDLHLLQYLEKKLPRVSLFWITKKKVVLSSRITPVANLSSFYNIYLKKHAR